MNHTWARNSRAWTNHSDVASGWCSDQYAEILAVGKQQMTRYAKTNGSLGASTSVLGVGAIFRSWHWARMYHFPLVHPSPSRITHLMFLMIVVDMRGCWLRFCYLITRLSHFRSIGNDGQASLQDIREKGDADAHVGIGRSWQNQWMIILYFHVYSVSVSCTAKPPSFFLEIRKISLSAQLDHFQPSCTSWSSTSP